MTAAGGLEDADLPGLFDAADKASRAAQTSFLRLTSTRLWMVLIASLTGAISYKQETKSGLELELAALLTIIAFAAALACEVALLRGRPERRWYDGRALAESSKTLAWRYAVRAEPFANESVVGDSDALLVRRLDQLLEDTPGAVEVTESPRASITPRMKSLRASDLETRRRAYLQDRVLNQKTWYADKATWNRKRGSAWRKALVGLEVLGLTLALMRFFGMDVGLASVAATAVAAGGAWLQAKQYGQLERAYSYAAIELSNIEPLAALQAEDEAWAAFVADAEEAMSKEHTMWRASRTQHRT